MREYCLSHRLISERYVDGVLIGYAFLQLYTRLTCQAASLQVKKNLKVFFLQYMDDIISLFGTEQKC